MKTKLSEALAFIGSFIDEHQNKEVRVLEQGFGYVDYRLDDDIDWSELLQAVKLIEAIRLQADIKRIVGLKAVTARY